MRVGIAHHLGWAVAVTASVDHQVVVGPPWSKDHRMALAATILVD